MGRGRSKIGNAGVTAAQSRTINRIASRTRNLKNEQYRVVNEAGEVVLEKKGSGSEVAATVGEKRQYLNGAVTIHNHPDGGTFSDADLNEFGYGARQIVVATPEGTYKLTNTRYGTPDQSSGWLEMRNKMDAEGVTRERSVIEIREEARQTPAVARQAAAMRATSDKWVAARRDGRSQETLDKLMARYNEQENAYRTLLHEAERKIETRPYHDFYRKNASSYGFKYEFIK